MLRGFDQFQPLAMWTKLPVLATTSTPLSLAGRYSLERAADLPIQTLQFSHMSRNLVGVDSREQRSRLQIVVNATKVLDVEW